MEPEVFVVDASVVAKWFLDDERSTREATEYLVRLLADEMELHAPVLLLYEFGNIITKAQRDGGRPIDHDRSAEALEIFLEYPIAYHDPGKPGLLSSLKLANRYGCSFQDSTYLWLAMSLQCRLLTADTRFVQRIPPDVVQKYIQGL